jgi:hypothetical protein
MVDGIAMLFYKYCKVSGENQNKKTHRKGGCQVKSLLLGIYYEKVIKSINKP